MKERPKGDPRPAARPRTWCDHAEARGALAQLCALPAPVLDLQYAVPAWPAGAHAVLLPSAGLSFYLLWRGERADQGHSCLHWPCSLPCHSALPASPPPTDSSALQQAMGPSPPHGVPRPAVSFRSMAQARHNSPIATVGTVLPPLLWAGLPHGATEGDSVRQDENAPDRQQTAVPTQPHAPGHGSSRSGVTPISFQPKGLECRCPGEGAGDHPRSGPTHQSCSGSHSSSTGAPSSRAGCTCCPRRGHIPYLRSWCSGTGRGSLRKQGPGVSGELAAARTLSSSTVPQDPRVL